MMDETQPGLLPVCVNAVLLKQSHAHSCRCCAGLLSRDARGGYLQQVRPTKLKIFTPWHHAEKVCQALLWKKDCTEVHHKNSSGYLYVAGLQMSFIFFLIFCIIHTFYKGHILFFIISKTIKVIKNQSECPTNSF